MQISKQLFQKYNVPVPRYTSYPPATSFRTGFENEIYIEQIKLSNSSKPENISIVRLGMRDCVLVGSCRRLSSLPVPVAGKTGTAQWNRTKANHAWFTSFAPFDNPQVVVTIMVEEGEEGSKVAAAIAYEFYQWWTSPASKSL